MPKIKILKYLTSPIIVILIIFLTFALYADVLFFDFINFDDNTYIYDNPLLTNGLTWTSVHWAWTKFGAPYYMPLTRLSYIIDAEVFNINPAGFHLTNLVLHVINSVLVFFISKTILKSIFAGGLVAIFFSIHPQHVEAVAWISQRKELLAAFFGLLSFLFYMHNNSVNSSVRDLSTPNYLFYLLSLIFFLLSLLSKPTWVMLPFLLLIFDWCCFDNKDSYRFLSFLKKISLFIAIALSYSLIHLYSTSAVEGHVITSLQSLSLIDRVLNAPVILLHYLIIGIFPFSLAGYQPYPYLPYPLWQTVISTILIISVFIIPAFRKTTNNLIFMGLTWFFISLLPVIGILGTGESILIGDRWTYLPHIGLFIAAVQIIKNQIQLRYKYKAYILSFLFLYISAHIYTTNKTIKYWKNSATYWTWSINTTTNNHYAHIKLGEHYEKQGLLYEAKKNYLKAHEINHEEPLYVIFLGNIYAKDNEDKAWFFYKKLLTTSLAPIEIIFKMGFTFMVNKDFVKAKYFFDNLIIIASDSNKNTLEYYFSHFYIAHLELITGNEEGANYFILKGLELLPFNHDKNCEYARSIILAAEDITNFRGTISKLDAHCINHIN